MLFNEALFVTWFIKSCKQQTMTITFNSSEANWNYKQSIRLYIHKKKDLKWKEKEYELSAHQK